MRKRQIKKYKRGFPLVEMIVTVTILGVVSLIALPAISRVSDNFSASKKDICMSSFESALKLWIDSHAIDEFGNQNSGCNDYTITELTENEVFATISEIDFEECGIDPDNLRARVRKINDVFEYTFYNLQIQK